MTPAILHLAGERLLLDPAGAVFHPETATLAVADLHLEKGSAAARHGSLVPPWDTRLTLDRLALLLRHWRPRTLVALGDSFHDPHAASRLQPADAARLAHLAAETQVVWVRGNHDPLPPAGLAGLAVPEWAVGALTFRHEARRGGADEVCGHHHPKAQVPTRAGPVGRACFVSDTQRLMLPAFGAYAGGLDVTSPAIAGLFPRGGRVFLLGRERLFSFTLAQLRRRPAPAAPATA